MCKNYDLDTYTKNVFAERLTELRKHTKLSQRGFAEEINKTQSLVAMWEKGTREPSMTTVALLANYFKVTPDYLMGFSDAPHMIKINKDEMEVIEYLRGSTELKEVYHNKQKMIEFIDVWRKVIDIVKTNNH